MAAAVPEDEQEMLPVGTTEPELELEPIERVKRTNRSGIRNWQAYVNSFKSFVGVGILALPFALAQSGLLTGVLVLVVVAFASSFTIKQVVKCKNELIIADRPADSYETVAGEILGRAGYVAAVAGIAASQLGFCISYVLFLVENISLLLALHLPESIAPHLISRFATILLLPFLIGLSLIREMKSLSFTSAIGMILLFAGTVLITGYGFTKLELQPSYPALRLNSFYLFFGLAVFGFEGVNLAIPIEGAMLHQKSYPRGAASGYVNFCLRVPIVLDMCIASVTVMYITFAVIGYLCFRDDVQAIIVANLPEGAWITRLVAASLILEVLVSYPVQLWPVLGLLEAQLPSDSPHFSLMRTCVRVGSAILIVVAATALPYFSLFSNLVGALANSATMFILPPLMDMVLHRQSATSVQWVVNVSILVLGVAASGISSVLTVKDIAIALGKV